MKSKTDHVKNVLITTFWILLFLFCFLNRENVTVDNIVRLASANTLYAVIIMFALFAIKGATVFIYGGILFAAVGIIFPLPLAIAVNIVGIAIMTSVPYFIGKKSGAKLAEKLMKKYPKLESVLNMGNSNGFLTVLTVRLIGILPSDIVGMYFGVSGVSYVSHLCGSVAGLLPTALSFTVMGASASDIRSPAFIISTAFQVILIALSFTITYVLHRKKKKT